MAIEVVGSAPIGALTLPASSKPLKTARIVAVAPRHGCCIVDASAACPQATKMLSVSCVLLTLQENVWECLAACQLSRCSSPFGEQASLLAANSLLK